VKEGRNKRTVIPKLDSNNMEAARKVLPALWEKKRETKKKRKIQIGSARATKDLHNTITPSSNVAGYGYDASTEILIMTFDDGSRYKYLNVSTDEWIKISIGAATTQDGKSPSVGAAVWQYLIRAGKPYSRI